jgi:DNA-binding PadR family transcriptional regulator
MTIRYAILGLLHYKDLYGYRIKKHIEDNFGHMWSINYGQIYPNLKKLCENGFIVMKEMQQKGQKGPPRKLYSITQEGRDEFQRWLKDSPEQKMLIRDPFLMRFVFFGFGNKERAVEIIDEQIADYQDQLDKRYRNKEKWKDKDIYVNLIADLGIEFNEMVLKWLHHSREAILDETQNRLTERRFDIK